MNERLGVLLHPGFGFLVDFHRVGFALHPIDIFVKALEKVSEEFLRILLSREGRSNAGILFLYAKHTRSRENAARIDRRRF